MEYKLLGERVQELMEEYGETPEVFDRIIGLSPGLTQRIIDGTASIGIGVLEKIAVRCEAIPLLFYRKTDQQVENGGEENILYGLIPEKYIPQAIRKHFEENGISQADVAKKLKLAPSTISMFLAGARELRNIQMIEAMALCANLIPAYLVPKVMGNPPPLMRPSTFEEVLTVFERYLTDSPARFSLIDLHTAIKYGERMKELVDALKVRYSLLSRNRQ